MMKNLSHLLILSYLIVPTLFAGDFDTPHETISLMLKAAETGDADLWSSGLSDSDRDILKYIKNSPNYQHTISERARFETERGSTFKGTDEDFYLARWIVEIPNTLRENETENDLELFKQHFIIDEYIWDDRYAEVVAMIPVSIKGPIGPMVFPLIRERGKWKLLQWLAEDRYLGTGRPAEKNHEWFISSRLRARALLTINRSNCSSLKERHWPMPAEISAFYETKLKGAEGFAKERIMEYWLISGDKKAFKYAKNDPQCAGFLKDLEKTPQKYKPCSGWDKFTNADVDNITPNRWYDVSGEDVVALNNLIRAFPHDLKWKAKAELRIGYLYEEWNNYQDLTQAESVYRKVILDYPDQNEASEARIKLADLFWKRLNKQKEAIEIWKDLDSRNQLPLGTPYDKLQPAPTIIYDDQGDGFWYPPIGDYLPINDDILILTSQGINKTHGRKTTSLATYNISQKTIHYLPEPPGGPYKELHKVHSGYYALNPDRAVFLNTESVIKRMLVPETTYTISLPYPYVGDIPAGIPMLSWDMGDKDYLVWYDDVVRRFDYSGNNLDTYPTPGCVKGNDRHIIRNNHGDVVYISSGSVCIAKRGYNNKAKELKGPYNLQGSFQRAFNPKIDTEGNIYLLAVNDRGAQHKYIKLANDGALLTQFEWNKSGAPWHHAIGPDGNIYVLYWDKASNAPNKIIVFDNNFSVIREIDMHKAVTPNYSQVSAFEVDSKNIYLISNGNNLRVVNLAGDNVGSIKLGGYSNRLTKDKYGQVYLSGGGKIYRVTGATIQFYAAPVLPPYDIEGSTVPPIYFQFGPNGEMYGHVWDYGIFRYDSISSKPIQVEPKNPNIVSKRVSSFAIAPQGLLYVLDKETYLITLDPKTGATKLISAAKTPRQNWQITEAHSDGMGNFYLFDKTNMTLLKYNENEKYLGEFDLRPYSTTALPYRIRVDDSGNVFSMFVSGMHYTIYRFNAADIKWN